MQFILAKAKNIMYLGALWGLSEATLGYLLHWLPIGLAGALMFPIGAFFLYQAWQKDRSYTVVAAVTALAALIKSVDFFLPMPSPMSVINPISAILLQGVILSVLFPYLEKKHSLLIDFGTVFSWIFLFTAFQIIVFKPIDGLWLAALPEMIAVFAVISLLGGAFLHVGISKERTFLIQITSFSPSWLHCMLIFAFAIALEALNSLI